jgi:undecaprenyl-diphosphatase
MTFIHALLLGIIQGLTEFIPVSSTAHLLIGQGLLGLSSSDGRMFSFTVIIQLGTVLAMLVFFWKDLLSIVRAFFSGLWNQRPFETHDSLVGWLVIVATLPALVVGFLLKDFVNAFYNNPILIAAVRLLMTAVLLSVVEYFGRHERTLESASWMDAIAIGAFQILSIFPGASRSGSSIAGGILRGFDRPSAARMAFLMSAPILTAAGAYESFRVMQMPGIAEFMPYLAVGFVTAGVVGWFALKWLMGYLRDHSIYSFAGYCAIVGLICLAAIYLKS